MVTPDFSVSFKLKNATISAKMKIIFTFVEINTKIGQVQSFFGTQNRYLYIMNKTKIRRFMLFKCLRKNREN